VILEGMHTSGIIILRDIINTAHLDAINNAMLAEVEELEKKAHHNFGVRNIQHSPPLIPESEVFFDDVYINPLLLHAVTLYIGPNPKFNFLSGNTALPKGDKRQPVHSDLSFEVPNYPLYVVANISLIDSTPEVGNTEVWPGTHLSTIADQVSPQYYEIKKELLSNFTPLRPIVPKGSVVLRDLRLWHAGMPNPSNVTRFMLGLAYCSYWYRSKYFLPVPISLQARLTEGLKKWGITPLLEGIPDDEYLRQKDDYTFSFEQDKEKGAPPHQNI